MNIRRTIGFIITVSLIGRLCYQLAWEPDLRDHLTKSPWQSLALCVLAIATAAFVAWSVISPSQWRTFLTFGLGIATALWGTDLLGDISWPQLGTLLGILVGLVLLWYITTWDKVFGS